MFAKRNVKFERVNQVKHPEHVEVNTRVSEYLRKYGSGKIDALPTDNRPEITDNRSDEEKLNDDFLPEMGTDPVDVMMMLDEHSDKLKAAVEEIELTKKQRVQFENAVKVLDDPNSSLEARQDAYRILSELEKKGKVSAK